MQGDEVTRLPEVQGAGVAEWNRERWKWMGCTWGRGDVCPKCTGVFQGAIWKDGQRNRVRHLSLG